MKTFSEYIKLYEVSYEFNTGDRVMLRSGAYRVGEIASMVPGDGITPWYFVTWEDTGQETRHTGDELEKV